MLQALRIRDLGVIVDVAVDFGPGLNVVTGETGAGKTMVVTGLNLLFGRRADASRVRTGADAASVEGRLVVRPGSSAALRALDAGGEIEDDELVLRRSVTTGGRSRAQVGGTSTPVAVLAELGEDFVVVHGQSDQMRLARPGAQRRALDRYAGCDTESFRGAFEQWRAAEATLAERRRDRGALLRESDLLAFGLGEIDAVAPVAGEDDELAVRAVRLAAADELRLAARAAHDALLGDADDPASDAADVRTQLTLAQRGLDQAADADPSLRALTDRTSDLIATVDDLGADLGAYSDGIDADPALLASTQTRQSELNSVIRKYAEPGTGLTGVLDWADRARGRLAQIDTSDAALAELAERRDQLEAISTERAGALSHARREAAGRLAVAVTAELRGLAMADARLHVVIRPKVAIAGSPSLPNGSGDARVGAGPDGVDEIELQLQPHPDSEPIALQKGASGGELSRVMLALEVVLAGTDPVPVMVFDEVDAGVGGRAAVEVGRRLARLGREHQVIVVTHLAQVAAFADRHLAVRTVLDGSVASGAAVAEAVASGAAVAAAGRSADAEGTGADGTGAGGRTVSEVVEVTGDERIAELARMLAGRDTATAREHAAELLVDAEQARGSAEQARGSAEQARGSAEQARGSAEQARGSAEQARGSAEHARGSAKKARAAATKRTK